MKRATNLHAAEGQATVRSHLCLLGILILLAVLLYFSIHPQHYNISVRATATNSSVVIGETSESAGPDALAIEAGPAAATQARLLANRAPVPSSPRLMRSAGTPLKVRASELLGSDPDGDSLSLSSVATQSLSGGSVTSKEGWLFYAPPAGDTQTDSFEYSVTDSRGSVSVGTVTVALASAEVFEAAPVVQPQSTASKGAVNITSGGIPGRNYTIEFKDDATAPTWQTLGTAAANAVGIVEYVDHPPAGSHSRVYRTRSSYAKTN